jgi:hypothetical protein
MVTTGGVEALVEGEAQAAMPSMQSGRHEVRVTEYSGMGV